jgi:hypothetical protein
VVILRAGGVHPRSTTSPRGCGCLCWRSLELPLCILVCWPSGSLHSLHGADALVCRGQRLGINYRLAHPSEHPPGEVCALWLSRTASTSSILRHANASILQRVHRLVGFVGCGARACGHQRTPNAPGLLAIHAQEPDSTKPQPTALIHSVLLASPYPKSRVWHAAAQSHAGGDDTHQPSVARCTAAARPIPVEAPVMSTDGSFP